MTKKLLLVGVSIGVLATMLVAGLLIPAMVGYSEQVFVHHGRGLERGGRWRNATVTQEQVTLSGRLVDLDIGVMTVRTSSGDVQVKLPMSLLVDGQPVSVIKLVFDGKLRKDDLLEVTALRITATLPDGSTRSKTLLVSFYDQSTGLRAEAPGRAASGPRAQSSTQGYATPSV
ncbi:MAG: hypothetical protein NZ957_01980 [Thaumarchaeota archaeon]|nr:hypothetical protein [Candidatus Calditenuaceae archaeon]